MTILLPACAKITAITKSGSTWILQRKTGQVIYDEYSDNIGAEYIDIVIVGSFDMHDDDFKTTMREAENYATLIMSDSSVRVKTHLTLSDPDVIKA